MHPELFTLPILGVPIRMYGFWLMVGFLSGVWLAMRRAQRVKADPDRVLDMSFLALIFGVVGARAFYVVHYWKSDFASAPNRLLAAIDITGGGLEFLGGFLGATAAILIYAVRKKVSARMYCDILAPSVMWGLAFARIGCFFNGCCFGGVCVVPSTQQPALAWAVRFPFGSPVHLRQWEDRRVTVPAELITSAPGALRPWLLPASMLSMSVEKREEPNRRYQELLKEYEEAKAESPDAKATAVLKSAVEAARKKKNDQDRKLVSLRVAQRFPSRLVPTRSTSVTELEDLAARQRSLPVHPTQLYSAIHGILLSGLLSALFYIRKRHGVVIGALFVLYPIPRAILEFIRADNPHDVAGLTASQFVSLIMLIVGVVYLIFLYKRLPERSPVLE